MTRFAPLLHNVNFNRYDGYGAAYRQKGINYLDDSTPDYYKAPPYPQKLSYSPKPYPAPEIIGPKCFPDYPKKSAHTAGCCLSPTTAAGYNASDVTLEVTIGVKSVAWDFNRTYVYPEVVEGCSRKYSVQSAIPHPDYDSDTLNNDIAVLILSEPIDFRRHNGTFPDPPRPDIPLKYVLQTILPDENCSYALGGDKPSNLDLFLCAGGIYGEDTCLGDSGGPLFCYDPRTRTQYLAGLTSFGIGTYVYPSVVEGCSRQYVARSAISHPDFDLNIANNDIGMLVLAEPIDFCQRSGCACKLCMSTQTNLDLFLCAGGTIGEGACFYDSGGPLFGYDSRKRAQYLAEKPPRIHQKNETRGPHQSAVEQFKIHQNRLIKWLQHLQIFASSQNRIVGGLDAPNGSASICWQVSVYIQSPALIALCGGVIIGTQTILTAGHCVAIPTLLTTLAGYNASDVTYTVTIGAKSVAFDFNSTFVYPSVVDGCSRQYKVRSAIPHPEFSLDTLNNDIALLILSEPIDFRRHSACACTLCLSTQVPKPGDRCVASGFGLETTDREDPNPPRPDIPLKYVLQTILPAENCSYALEGEDPNNLTNLDLFLCAGDIYGEGTCNGDSGGPLFCYDPRTRTQYLAGLTSFGAEECSDGRGNGFTKVNPYLPWIFNNAPLGDVTVMI
ncbi:transmembrane protease serine 9-like [Paramacrobiotus metropolitanus]|uniref:transmembrane protease serine 9-like n=1 Tax=Paramacrobiotus metropolitanus TaxID=2943436 RepID=UPI002445BB22|nr:transmembrane protease serine 9-like [Paramacrobiotus metropolitanus]